MIGGADLLGGAVQLGGVSADVDIDGDGLEFFEVTSTGAAGCQPVISACIDGNGTRIEGHDCVGNPAIADGLSGALVWTASRTTLRAN
jgi:hypothetical protein